MPKRITPRVRKRRARRVSRFVVMAVASALGFAQATSVPAQGASPPAHGTQSVEQTTSAVQTSTEAAPDQAESEQLESVVVTGTRIARGGFEAPTPVSVVGADRAQELANTNIGDLLNQLPAFRPTNTPASTGLGAAANYVGGRILDLRGMGAVRTLVLVDGKRFTPSTTQATVDTNMIPLSLLDRAEVVTGGASAAYGSDAVAGVVNFILNQKLDGIRSSLEYGVSSRGDNKTATGSLAGGTRLFSGRGHFIGAFEFEDDRGVGDCEVRLWCSEGWLNFGNAPAGSHGLPANNILPNVNPSTISPTGVINSPTALHGITFNPDGTPRPFVYGSLVNSLYMVGGEGHGQDGYFQGLPIVAPNQRYLAYTRTNYNFTDDLQGAVDVSFGHLLAHGDGTQYRSVALPIQRTNPFIPGSTNPALDIPTILANNPGITSFNLGRNFADIGNPLLRSRNNLLRAVLSLKGKIAGSWTWDAYYQYGHNDFEVDADNDVITANITSAIDAVANANGQIVCRANLVTVMKPACVPLNPFGNQVSAAAHAYVTGTSVQTDLTTEHVVAGNVQGEPFSTWAGAASLAGGVEYRSDKIDGGADPISQNLGFFVNNAANINGKVNVAEAYAESLVPLLKDLPLARNVDFNSAVRRTHYDRSSPTAGSSTVSTTTWKLGLTWQLIESFRIRGTRSRDIRAPNVSELYGPNTTGFGILNDPARGGLQTNPVVLSGSNAHLVPEVADTWTAGFVVQPATDGWLGRLQMSADYYDIKLKNAIGNLGAQTIATRCFQGATEFCSLITRDANGVITQISDVLQNVNQQITRGVDLELAYRQPMGRFGNTDFRLLANYVANLITIDSAGAVDRAGQTGLRGGTIPGMPRYTLDGFINWADGGFNTSLHTRFIPDGIYNAAFIGPDQPGYSITNPASSNNNHVKSALYLDLVTQYEFSGRGGRSAFTVYGGVDNLTNVDPPRVPGANGTGNNVLFDPVGRMWKVGVRYRQ